MARPTSDGTWRIDEAMVVQMDEDSGENNAQVRLTISNTSDSPQRLSLFDVAAIDRAGHRLEVDPEASLFFEELFFAPFLLPAAATGN